MNPESMNERLVNQMASPLSPAHARILAHGVSGGSDDGGEGFDPMGTPDAPAPKAAAPEAAPEPSNITPEYVSKLREEAKGYRTQLRQYEEVFDGYEPEVAETWLNAARLWKEDPATVARWMQEQANGVLSADNPLGDEPPADNGLSGSDGQPLTRDELFQLLEERDQQAAQAQAVQQVQDTARQMGYDPTSPDYVELLWFANNQTDGDLEAAHAKVQERREQILQQLLEEKRQQASGPAPAPQGGVPTAERQIADWADARRAAEERMNSL